MSEYILEYGDVSLRSVTLLDGSESSIEALRKLNGVLSADAKRNGKLTGESVSAIKEFGARTKKNQLQPCGNPVINKGMQHEGQVAASVLCLPDHMIDREDLIKTGLAGARGDYLSLNKKMLANNPIPDIDRDNQRPIQQNIIAAWNSVLVQIPERMPCPKVVARSEMNLVFVIDIDYGGTEGTAIWASLNKETANALGLDGPGFYFHTFEIEEQSAPADVADLARRARINTEQIAENNRKNPEHKDPDTQDPVGAHLNSILHTAQHALKVDHDCGGSKLEAKADVGHSRQMTPNPISAAKNLAPVDLTELLSGANLGHARPKSPATGETGSRTCPFTATGANYLVTGIIGVDKNNWPSIQSLLQNYNGSEDSISKLFDQSSHRFASSDMTNWSLAINSSHLMQTRCENDSVALSSPNAKSWYLVRIQNKAGGSWYALDMGEGKALRLYSNVSGAKGPIYMRAASGPDRKPTI